MDSTGVPDRAAAVQDAANRNKAAMRAMAAGDLVGAEAALLVAVGVAQDYLPAWLNLAAVRRQRNDLDGAFTAIQQALTLDGRNFAALLMSANMLEREGHAVPAALAYGAALANAPPDQAVDAATLQAIRRGREVHGAYTQQLGEHIRGTIADAASDCTLTERRRIDSFIAMTLRIQPRYQQSPSEYYYPGLPPIEFYDRSEFPWLEEFEAQTDAIRAELANALHEHEADFTPYIHYGEHMPLDQWRELNNSPRWTSYEFYRQGQPIADRCERAPATMRAVQALPQADVPLRSPVAMYSALQPRTRIPPHTGVANFRLVVHLPLVIPPGCGFRVGSETREWRIGEGWVFDDTIEHEAWNDSDVPRYILICDIWSPRLSPQERAAIAGVIAATDSFNGTVPSAHI
ncbi:MAG: aspartyl/asparaginyl beta-hydroxylase domain-containing protein [Proteobacteria bacterium]|nr:aspartyl/asparaginyl beta-hydroxylase domain-containing protein [Pseudomonadota bacterium]